MFLLIRNRLFVKISQSWIICTMEKNIVCYQTHQKWGDMVLKVCPSIQLVVSLPSASSSSNRILVIYVFTINATAHCYRLIYALNVSSSFSSLSVWSSYFWQKNFASLLPGFEPRMAPSPLIYSATEYVWPFI